MAHPYLLDHPYLTDAVLEDLHAEAAAHDFDEDIATHTDSPTWGEVAVLCSFALAAKVEIRRLCERPFPTGIWCPRCEQTQPLRADEPRDDAGKKWGDLCCGACHYVVATVEYGGENGD